MLAIRTGIPPSELMEDPAMMITIIDLLKAQADPEPDPEPPTLSTFEVK